MEMPVYKCMYTGGMNKDHSPNDYPNTCYYDATNFRVVTSDSSGLSDSSLSTLKGHAASFTIPNFGKLIGYTILRDCLVILVHAHGETNPDRIYRIPLSELTTASDITLNNVYWWNPGTNYLVYLNDLSFDPDYPAKIIGNYENSNIQKIYWIDGINSLRHLNIVYNSIYNDLTTLSPELLEISPLHTYGSYSLSESTGGRLKAGRIQYSYQLYSVSGTETMFAPPSNLYNLTSYNISDGLEFVGNDIETTINKSITITITLTTNTILTFNRIRLVALEYEIYGDIPTIRVVTEQELISDTVVLYDYGDSIGEMVLEEFQVTKNDLIPKTLESVKGYLFAGNITEEYFDIDNTIEGLSSQERDFFDARVYRWRYATTDTDVYSSQTLTKTTDPHAIENIPSYSSNSFDTDPTFISYYFTDTAWDLSIRVGAPAHAAAQFPVRVVTGVSAVNGPRIVVSLYQTGVGWTKVIYLTEWDRFTYTAEDVNHGILHIWGTKYSYGMPSTLSPSYPSSYNKSAVTELSYTYTYKYVGNVASVECVLNKGFSTPYLVHDGTNPIDWDVPEKDDCINTYNNIENDENTDRDHEFKYKTINATNPPTISDLGGSGRFISYGFTYRDEIAGTKQLIDEHPIITSTTTTDVGYKNPQTVLNYTSNQRDEVYRYGIVFYDLKGRPSFPKWVGDIRFPKMCEELDPGNSWSHLYEICPVDGVDPEGIMNIRILGIQFSIDWDAIEADHPGLIALLSGFQFVRMQRKDSDCTIKASGIILPTIDVTVVAGQIKDGCYSSFQVVSAKDYEDNTTPQLTGITGTNAVIKRDLVELISPEIAINKNLTIDKSTDFLQAVGYISNPTTKISTTDRDAYTVSTTTITAYHSTNDNIRDDWRRVITDGLVSLPQAKLMPTNIIDGISFNGRGYDGDVNANHPEITYKGTTLVVSLDGTEFTNVTNGGVTGTANAMYGYYRKPLGYSIYGGNTYESRSYSSYIKAGEFTAVSSSGTGTYAVYGGDTYITPFAFMKLMFDSKSEYGSNNSGQVLITFPVESRINLSYRLDKLNKYFYPDGSTGFYLAEYQSTGVSQYPNNYPVELGDLYRYNSAYSAENISKEYSTKPFDFRGVNEQDTLVASSERKLSGEYKDSWLIFKYNNYIDLDGECGAITRLINKNDKLFAFQPRGIASLSVLEREVIESNNTSTLAVGSGGILSRSDYLTRTIGTNNYFAIIDTEMGIYFYDDNNSCIYRIGDGLEAISDTKGMKSYFSTKKFTSLISTYDKRNREVLFSPGITHTENTLVFSGFLDAFTAFYTLHNLASSAYVEKYITFDKYLLSSIDSNKFYLHDAGNYNSFYGETHASTITILANPNKSQAVSFQVIQWLMDVTNAGVEVVGETFASVRVTNSYQDTGVLSLPGTTGLIRRFRTWRMNVFRDSLVINSYGRIRDSWIKALFSYTPLSSNNKAVVHPIEFSIQPTKIQ